MAITRRIDLFIRPTSSVTKEYAKQYAFDMANTRDDQDENIDDQGDMIYAHYYDVTDSRDGSKYMVFGTKAQELMSLPRDLEILDKSEFVMGYSNEVIISNVDGTVGVKLTHILPFSVLLDTESNFDIELRVENKTAEGFEIVVYDNDTFEEDKKYDCSTQNITVKYTVIYT